MAKSYSEKLKDPKWQKKRLEILSRDNWACTSCGDKKSSLQVHHYEYRRVPWTVKSDKLTTLCETCHAFIEQVKSVRVGSRVVGIKKRVGILDANKRLYLIRSIDSDETDCICLYMSNNINEKFKNLGFSITSDLAKIMVDMLSKDFSLPQTKLDL